MKGRRKTPQDIRNQPSPSPIKIGLLSAGSLKGTGCGRKYVVRIASDQANRAHHHYQNNGEHYRILSDVLALFVPPQLAKQELMFAPPCYGSMVRVRSAWALERPSVFGNVTIPDAPEPSSRFVTRRGRSLHPAMICGQPAQQPYPSARRKMLGLSRVRGAVVVMKSARSREVPLALRPQHYRVWTCFANGQALP